MEGRREGLEQPTACYTINRGYNVHSRLDPSFFFLFTALPNQLETEAKNSSLLDTDTLFQNDRQFIPSKKETRAR